MNQGPERLGDLPKVTLLAKTNLTPPQVFFSLAQCTAPPLWHSKLPSYLVSLTLLPFNLLVSLTLVSYSSPRVAGSVVGESRHSGFESNPLGV